MQIIKSVKLSYSLILYVKLLKVIEKQKSYGCLKLFKTTLSYSMFLAHLNKGVYHGDIFNYFVKKTGLYSTHHFQQ